MVQPNIRDLWQHKIVVLLHRYLIFATTTTTAVICTLLSSKFRAKKSIMVLACSKLSPFLQAAFLVVIKWASLFNAAKIFLKNQNQLKFKIH